MPRPGAAASPPPRGIRVTRAGEPVEEIRLTFTAPRFPLWLVILLCVSVAAMFGAVLPENGSAAGYLVGAGLVAALVWMAVADRRHPRVLVLTRERVRLEDGFFSAERGHREVALATVRDVRLHRSASLMGAGVALWTPQGPMIVGQGLSLRARRWLRDFIAEAVATA